jgi:hypothetical protein
MKCEDTRDTAQVFETVLYSFGFKPGDPGEGREYLDLSTVG